MTAKARAFERQHPELACLGALLILGIAARFYVSFAWRPAFTGYSDSGIYFQGAYQDIWADPIRTAGYGMFLAVLHWISPHLLLVSVVQHLLGLCAGVLLFLTVRRIGGPPWLGLVPAAVIVLGGPELIIEHAALSEAVYIFLLSVTLYCAVRAWRGGLGWAALAGLCLGLSVWDRAASVSLLPVIPLWLLFCRGRPTRRTMATAALALVVGVATVGVYVQWRQLATDQSGLTTNGNWNLYGRVASWADCSKFTPPGGTEQLCDRTPLSQRADRNGEWYIYRTDSPAQLLLGLPFEVSRDPYAMDRLWNFSMTAIESQPLDYLNAVWHDAVRVIDTDHPSDGALSADAFIDYLVKGLGDNFVNYWQTREYPNDSIHHGAIGALKQWEKITRIDGVVMALLLALCCAAPWVVVGEARSAARLLSAVTLVLLFFPVITKGYDYRFMIPAFGVLTATAALSAWSLTARVRLRRSRIAST